MKEPSITAKLEKLFFEFLEEKKLVDIFMNNGPTKGPEYFFGTSPIQWLVMAFNWDKVPHPYNNSVKIRNPGKWKLTDLEWRKQVAIFEHSI